MTDKQTENKGIASRKWIKAHTDYAALSVVIAALVVLSTTSQHFAAGMLFGVAAYKVTRWLYRS